MQKSFPLAWSFQQTESSVWVVVPAPTLQKFKPVHASLWAQLLCRTVENSLSPYAPFFSGQLTVVRKSRQLGCALLHSPIAFWQVEVWPQSTAALEDTHFAFLCTDFVFSPFIQLSDWQRACTLDHGTPFPHTYTKVQIHRLTMCMYPRSRNILSAHIYQSPDSHLELKPSRNWDGMWEKCGEDLTIYSMNTTCPGGRCPGRQECQQLPCCNSTHFTLGR